MQQLKGRHFEAKRLSEITSQYEQNFSARGDTSSVEPLEYHLYHLALYWSRLMGFCGSHPSDAAHWVNSDLGACVSVGTAITSEAITSQHRFHEAWVSYQTLTDSLLHDESTSFEAVKSASDAFTHFLDLMGYVSWQSWTPTPSSPVLRLPRK